MSCGGSQKIALEYMNKDIPMVYRVTLKFKYVPSYCGGAAPSPEMERERIKGFPWASQLIYMNKGDSTEFESFVTDNFGQLRLALLKGDYCLKSAYKIDPSFKAKYKSEGWEFDEACFQELINKCDYSFSVTKDTTIEYTVRDRCQYEGPTPCVLNPAPPPP